MPARAGLPVQNKSRAVAVYRAYDVEGVLLYVGTSFRPKARMKGHKYRSEWWPRHSWYDVQWFPNSVDASEAEQRAIATEGPLFNRAGVSIRYFPHPQKRAPGVTPTDGPNRDARFAEAVKLTKAYEDAAAELRRAVIAAHQAGGSVREIARIIGKSTNTIQRWIREG